ncbi:MAG: leucine-rich repeat domain-containing protein, partial [Candidatus Competibacteraceae bacterium]|nr:leucine-rich repeat domain-containing protein [Candidatus Competibacteraceae bacterium]
RDLEELNLHNNAISSLAPLAALSALRVLDLGYNNIADLSPLSELDALESLELGFGNPLAGDGESDFDIFGLFGASGANPVADLSPLAGLNSHLPWPGGRQRRDFLFCPEFARIAGSPDRRGHAHRRLHAPSRPRWAGRPHPRPYRPGRCRRSRARLAPLARSARDGKATRAHRSDRPCHAQPLAFCRHPIANRGLWIPCRTIQPDRVVLLSERHCRVARSLQRRIAARVPHSVPEPDRHQRSGRTNILDGTRIRRVPDQRYQRAGRTHEPLPAWLGRLSDQRPDGADQQSWAWRRRLRERLGQSLIGPRPVRSLRPASPAAFSIQQSR